jgi:hypothetical protein
VKVKAITNFTDLEKKVYRIIGTEFEVTEARGKHLIDLGFVEAIKGTKPKKAKAEKKVKAE